jgi:hypothetical protein
MKMESPTYTSLPLRRLQTMARRYYGMVMQEKLAGGVEPARSIAPGATRRVAAGLCGLLLGYSCFSLGLRDLEGAHAGSAVADLPAQASVAPLMTFPDCRTARSAGATPIMRGKPGYAPHLDHDRDGIACE